MNTSVGLILFMMSFGFAQENLTQEEKEDEIIDFSHIKSVLKSDGLDNTRDEKKKIVAKIKKEKKKIKMAKYDYPVEEDFWRVISELWLIKNAQILRWDFPKPDYGIKTAFRNLLEKYGHYNIDFKVLILNTPLISHFGLPAGKNSYIFLLSLPFMRGPDLTKVDISLLLLEDFFRLRRNQLIDNLNFDKKIIGGNFKQDGFSKDLFTPLLKQITQVVMKKGFTFEQQFLVTKDMDSLLKGSPSLWNTYFKLHSKIDGFIKTDILFKNYLKIYPSPELQIKWLSPKKKVI